MTQETAHLLDAGILSLKGKLGSELQAPDFFIELGSGYANAFADYKKHIISECSFSDLLHFPKLTVPGHTGKISFAQFGNKSVAIVSGRKHLYEGASPDEVVRVTRIFAHWGTKHFIFTNAAGSLDPKIGPGSIASIEDYYNASGKNILVGKNDPEIGNLFFGMEDLRDKDFELAFCKNTNTFGRDYYESRKAIYAFMLGPRFETAFEVRMLQKLGVTLVGMSTYPQVEALAHMRTLRQEIKINGFSIVSNYAQGITSKKIKHEDVLDVVNKTAPIFGEYLYKTIQSCK